MIGALYRRACERRWNRDRRRHASEMRRLEQTAQAREVDHLDALALQLAQIRSLPRVHTSGRARALDAWRDAAQLVSTRWEDFRQAGSETRGWAFESYVAALDAEEATAEEMARLRGRRAA
jgi:hypothetical protein